MRYIRLFATCTTVGLSGSAPNTSATAAVQPFCASVCDAPSATPHSSPSAAPIGYQMFASP